MTLNMPGFTAEASLSNVSGRYQATTEAVFYGGIVQPALSDVVHEEAPGRHVYPDLYNCLKRECVQYHVYPPDPDDPRRPRKVCVRYDWIPARC
jgi:hypothetical protein